MQLSAGIQMDIGYPTFQTRLEGIIQDYMGK